MTFPPRRLPAPALLVLALATAGAVRAQAPAAPAPAQAPPPGAPASGDDPVVATFEGGTITKSEVLGFLGQYAILPDRREEVYTTAINALINQKLLARFLEEQQVALTAAELDAEVARLGQQLQQSGQGNLNGLLAEMNLTPTELRERLSMSLRWSKHLRSKADEATLGAYFEENKDLFTNTTVQASHILARVEPDASEEDQEAARRKLAELKRKIDAGEAEFAVVADEVSEDPSNQEAPDGGNIGYIARRGDVVDAFADAAFALEVGQVSEPVETDYGYHLIRVTDRRQGQEVTFDQLRDTVLAIYGEELQQRIVEEAREAARIVVKPMPEDFFPEPAPALGAPAIPGAPAGAPVR